MEDIDSLVTKIVDGMIYELRDRRGFRQLLDDMDEDIFDELHDALAKNVKSKITGVKY